MDQGHKQERKQFKMTYEHFERYVCLYRYVSTIKLPAGDFYFSSMPGAGFLLWSCYRELQG